MLKDKTVLISGASRGIGQAIAHRFAREGANIVILTKDSPNIMDQVSNEILEAGGKVLCLDVNVSHHEEIKEAVALAYQTFKGIDILVNNTSANCFTDTLNTTSEQFDLIISTSVKAAFFLTQTCIPHLKNAVNPHVINISPHLNLEAQWFKNHLAFSLGKYAMSMCTLGMSAEFQDVAVNSLWPQSTIATQSIKDHLTSEVYEASRWPSIMGDAAYELTKSTYREYTGQFFTDEALLRKAGVKDFSNYAVNSKKVLMLPLFIPLKEGMTPITTDLFLNKRPS